MRNKNNLVFNYNLQFSNKSSVTGWITYCCRKLENILTVLIQDVYKMLRQTLGLCSSYKNKEKCSYQHMSQNEWLFSLNERLHLKINTLNMK
jgi:hypothetical protein